MAQRVKECKKVEELGEKIRGLTIFKITHTYKYAGIKKPHVVLTYKAERVKDMCIPATIRLHAKSYKEIQEKAIAFGNYYDDFVDKMKPYRKDQILYRKKLAAFINEYMKIGPERIHNKYFRC